jgi:hypothetical protein
MKKVNLDEEYEKFKTKFCEIHELEKAWQEYQQENDLIDETNKMLILTIVGILLVINIINK